MDIARLQNRVDGKVIGREHREYFPVWEANWNQLRPERYPDVIVQAASNRDVVEAVKFARENRFKVAVRGGGHAWCGTPLRKGGMLVDLLRLNEVKIDSAALTAAIQPFISNRDLMRALEPYQLAFPVGHCPQVKASGYLLSGGIGWNGSEWGHACASVTADTLAVLVRCPHKSLRKTVAEPATFESLFAFSGSMWPECHRNRAESLWSNSSPADILCAICGHFTRTPNPKTLVLFALYPGWAKGVPSQQDTALSMAARVYSGPWTMWEDRKEDAANIEWHRKCCEILKPFACGRYLGESDIIDDRSRAEEAFASANWKRLQELRAKYDPDGLFHGFFGGL
jgi:FAD/FMN-containing dehydrogenase